MPAPWQRELAEAFTSPRDLLAFLGLADRFSVPMEAAAAAFPMRVPRSFARRMRHGDPDDPLLRQVLPQSQELIATPGFVTDPVGDVAAVRQGGLVQKYRGRTLVITTAACAVHCRYCFRRHFPYADHACRDDLARHLARHLEADDSVTEVVLSGGDPLALSNRRLARLLEVIGDFPRIRRLRLHTRVPVVLPSRVSAGLLGLLAEPHPFSLVFVLHINHAQEMDGELAAALLPLRKLGIPLLNQAVLLRGINDSAAIQAELAETCFDAGVLPYYLHLLDPVAGAAHFAVADGFAAAMMEELRERLPGYLMPRLVREVPGAPAKIPVGA